eukprot:scaffold33579_cov58-Phaeocystis_antarctica.AAC.7
MFPTGAPFWRARRGLHAHAGRPPTQRRRPQWLPKQGGVAHLSGAGSGGAAGPARLLLHEPADLPEAHRRLVCEAGRRVRRCGAAVPAGRLATHAPRGGALHRRRCAVAGTQRRAVGAHVAVSGAAERRAAQSA